MTTYSSLMRLKLDALQTMAKGLKIKFVTGKRYTKAVLAEFILSKSDVEVKGYHKTPIKIKVASKLKTPVKTKAASKAKIVASTPKTQQKSSTNSISDSLETQKSNIKQSMNKKITCTLLINDKKVDKTTFTFHDVVAKQVFSDCWILKQVINVNIGDKITVDVKTQTRSLGEMQMTMKMSGYATIKSRMGQIEYTNVHGNSARLNTIYINWKILAIAQELILLKCVQDIENETKWLKNDREDGEELYDNKLAHQSKQWIKTQIMILDRKDNIRKLQEGYRQMYHVVFGRYAETNTYKDQGENWSQTDRIDIDQESYRKRY